MCSVAPSLSCCPTPSRAPDRPQSLPMPAHTTPIQVRFGHTDPSGIVYFPRIYEALHDVFEDLIERHLGERYHHILLEKKLGFPLVHSRVDFRRPLRFGDRPTVRVTCFHLGTSSIGLRYVFELDHVLCVDARQTTALTDLTTMKSRPLPDAWRARFEELREELPA